MEIKPEIGIGKLKFGFSRSQIEKIIGNPDKEWIDKENDNRNILVYNNLNLRLTLYTSEEMRLGYIESSNPLLTFQNQNIIGTDINYTKRELFGINDTNWDVENYHSFDSHFYEPIWLTLHSEFDKITHIELGVPFENEDDYKWPK